MPRTLFILTTLASCALACSPVLADQFTVTSLNDSGPGTLRQAISAANEKPGADTVSFHPAVNGLVTLHSSINVTDAVTIIGNGAGKTVLTGGPSMTPIQLGSGVSALGLRDLEINDSLSAVSALGGAELQWERCVFRGNGHGAFVACGVLSSSPGVHARFSGEIRSCSFIDNRGHFAGVMFTRTTADDSNLQFINCTMHGNSSSAGAGTLQIIGDPSPSVGAVILRSCTVTGNTGGVGGPGGSINYGAIHIEVTGLPTPVSCWIGGSIVAENIAGGPGVDPSFGGSGAAAHLVFMSPDVHADPMLGPVVEVEGLPVRIPLPGSPAIDAAWTDSLVPVDQLGTPRPFVAPGAVPQAGSEGADIGAVEYIPGPCPADFDQSGTRDVADIFAFLTAWFAGCP